MENAELSGLVEDRVLQFAVTLKRELPEMPEHGRGRVSSHARSKALWELREALDLYMDGPRAKSV